MSDLRLEHLQRWVQSKSKIFAVERLVVSISPLLGEEAKAQYVEVDGNGLLGRATLWESGSLELEALDEKAEQTVLQSSRVVVTPAELEDSLNWWLGEIAIYGIREA